jgi:hypothetical protein
MKTLTFTLASLLLSASAFAAGLGDVAGRYRITRAGSPVVHLFRVESTGAVYLTEKGPNGNLECWGSAQMVRDTLETAFACENGRAFEHKVFFGGTRFFANRFSARVTIDGKTRLMNFQKLMGFIPGAI